MQRKWLNRRRVFAGLLNVVAVAAIAGILLFVMRETGTPSGLTGHAAPLPLEEHFSTLLPEALAPVERLVIPSIEVDSPVIAMGMDEQNRMEIPDRPDGVAWYDFTATPGDPGNAVFAAHVNWRGGQEAVFGRLDELDLGDEVRVVLEDGRELRYRVVARESVTALGADVDAVVGPTDGEVVTLITCHGPYDWATRQYTERLVIRAARV